MSDPAKSNHVANLLDTIVGAAEGQIVSIAWMDAEIAGKIIDLMEGARTLFEMAGMKAGMTPEQAKVAATQQWILMAFELGYRVAESDASARAMKDLFGDWDPTTPPED